VLVESDGPVVFDSLGGVGGPCLVPTVIFNLSELWGQSYSDSRELVLQNSLRYLGERGKT